MNKPFVFAALLSVSAALAAPGALAAGDASAGKEKSSTCVACHGADGNSANPEWPKLAGQHPDYLVKQLKEFKAGERENQTMAPMAAPLSEQDMQDLAAYYAAQQIQYGEADPDLVELGEQIYRGGNKASGVSACMACHGPAGKGNPAANFPALAGQHATYTGIQLKAFRSGARANDYGSMMRNVAARMTDAEIKAVASYIQGLR
ncbi:cytochrome c subfamily [Thiohalobacter thiocyanaticus]|uniref:Cytochrome c subfamily n=1 Tax=Thiohalobacter thiocyanaticus TaxID=585455 RepID=A0A1Z4VMD2_9GAMM|nr:c-type cytochrome [Thiohalobacter thiocyanaticus]BAZ92771.1 cytochrome c subfamily [Thiohalobacter thiocyanaticus]